MEKIAEKSGGGGKLEVFGDMRQHLFLAQPHGIINPTLLEEDLKQATAFSERCPDHWTYCTNTEDVRLVNPFNLLFLKEIKKLKNLKQIVVFAPGFFNLMLLYIASPFVKPDRLIKSKVEYHRFLAEVT